MACPTCWPDPSGVYGNAYEAQDAMRDHIRSATTVICMATMLHTIATGNMTPSYRVLADGTIRPVYFYCVDIAEFAVNKLVDYICWVTLAGIMGRTFGEVLGIPLLSALTLLLVYGIEISSCFNNYFEYRGIKKRVNVFKLFGRREVEGVLEDLPDKNKKEEEK